MKQNGMEAVVGVAIACLMVAFSGVAAAANAAKAANAPTAAAEPAPQEVAPREPAPLAPAQIVISDFMFQPATVTVKAGTSITWVNKDDEPHTVRSDAGLFASGALDTNEKFSFRFDRPGTYRFVCSIHPQMVGIIVVQ
jgi:plastocyanin